MGIGENPTKINWNLIYGGIGKNNSNTMFTEIIFELQLKYMTFIEINYFVSVDMKIKFKFICWTKREQKKVGGGWKKHILRQREWEWHSLFF